MMERHYVTFYFHEGFSTRTIETWNVERAKTMARELAKYFHSTPYGFNFTTCRSENWEMETRLVMASPMYYLGNSVEPEDGDITLEWP